MSMVTKLVTFQHDNIQVDKHVQSGAVTLFVEDANGDNVSVVLTSKEAAQLAHMLNPFGTPHE